MKTRIILSSILAFVCMASAVAAAESFDDLEREFRELPMEARRLTGPLFWLHGRESQELLEQYVEKVAEGGNGCFTAESRPHIDWLGEGWYRDLAICLDAAKKHDLKMWIFDEKWWPSGEVGGMVPPEYGSKQLVMRFQDVEGPTAVAKSDWAGLHPIATLAGKLVGDAVDGDSLVDISGSVQNGALNWNAPEGQWRVMSFSWEHVAGRRILVDGASQDCADWYIETVYQPHYDRFPDDFGKDIVGFFFDEPETHGDWGTEVFKVLEERGVDWKKAVVAWKGKLAGEEQAAAQYQYRDALAEAWGRTLYGGITKWCRDHKVTSIGHFLEHRSGYLNQHICAGDAFKLMKYNDMGGIDAVFDQFVMGEREARDDPCWQTPKIASSVSHVYGKADDIAMVEIYGARGQDLSYPEMKWWADHMHVSGVSFLIPHSFNPKSPYDTDCPPYFYNNGFEPRWPLYRVFADYTSRLSIMLTGGRHVCPVALLSVGGCFQAGKAVAPDNMSEALQDALYDCDWMPYEVFEDDTQIEQGALTLYNECYRVLVVPAAEVIPYATLEKAKAFFDEGGVVVGYGMLPTASATLGRTSADIAKLAGAIWGDAKPGLGVCRSNASGGRSFFLPERPTPEEIQQVLAGEAGVHPTLEVVEGDTGHWLHVIHRNKLGRDLFFICNQNDEEASRRFRFRILAEGYPECWDALSNTITAVPFERKGEHAEIALTLASNESILLVFQPSERPLPLRLDGGVEPAQVIAVQRDPSPERPEPKPDMKSDRAGLFEGCHWMWFAGDGNGLSAPPGLRYFRKAFSLPAGRAVRKATFSGTADNAFVLYVNGQEAGKSDDSGNGWKNPVDIDVAALLAAGDNILALQAFNASDSPNPAGMLGKLVVEFEQEEPLAVAVDATWKCTNEEQAGWAEPGHDASAWPAAKEVAAFGGGPWSRLGDAALTLSPVKADPFHGHFELPALAAGSRVVLEMESIAPEKAACITVNGKYAGGFLCEPLHLDVTAYAKAGNNTLVVEPFAPQGIAAKIYAP